MNLGLKPFLRIFFGALLVVGAYAVLGMATPNTACATGLPPTPCDPQYMDALESRAWLEAQREITQNQNLIAKPDSVLEYTCFNRFLNVLAREAPNMFSATTRWGDIPDLGADSQADALARLMGDALVDYLDNNFEHTYLGGRAPQNYTYDGTVTRGDYTCDQMIVVWEAAKCMNFYGDGREGFDGFYDFAFYADSDPRNLPPGLECEPPTDMINTNMGIAFNNRQDTYVLMAENPNDAAPYLVDPLVTFLEFILPLGVEPATDCAAPIQTGITVRRQGMAPYPDAVCPNPGCYYTGPGNECNP